MITPKIADLPQIVACLRDKVEALSRPNSGGPARPVVRARRVADAAISPNADIYGHADTWVPDTGDDPDGLYGNDPDNNAVTITIATPGRYLLLYRLVMYPAAPNAQFVNWVSLNGASSIARDSRPGANAGGDGVTMHALCVRWFDTGDTIRFGMWASASTTVRAARYGAHSEIVIHHIGAR